MQKRSLFALRHRHCCGRLYRGTDAVVFSNKTTRWRITSWQIYYELWHWSPDSTWNVGTKLGSQGAVIWLPDGWMRFNRAGNGFLKLLQQTFMILNYSSVLGRFSTGLFQPELSSHREREMGSVWMSRLWGEWLFVVCCGCGESVKLFFTCACCDREYCRHRWKIWITRVHDRQPEDRRAQRTFTSQMSASRGE